MTKLVYLSSAMLPRNRSSHGLVKMLVAPSMFESSNPFPPSCSSLAIPCLPLACRWHHPCMQAVATVSDALTLPSSAPFIALCLPALSHAACAAPSLASPVIQLIHSALRISKPLLPHSRPRCVQVYQSASASLDMVASHLSHLHSSLTVSTPQFPAFHYSIGHST